MAKRKIAYPVNGDLENKTDDELVTLAKKRRPRSIRKVV